MKWFLIWLCVCNTDLQIVYAGHTEEKVRAYAVALWKREDVPGSYMVVELADYFEHEELCYYDNGKCRLRGVIHIGG